LAASLLISLLAQHTYVAFVRNAAFTSAKTLPTINFLLNGVVEMYMLDTGLAYQHAFVYIRELAIELRKALHQKGEEAARRVRSWAFFHSLRFFVRLLSTAQAQQGSELVLLVYPLMQLLEGAASLAKGAALLPLRLHLLELELELAEASGQHASVVPWLLEALDSAELRHRPRLLKAGESSRALDLSLVLRASKGQLRTRAFQEALFDFVLDLLYHQYAQVSCSIAFPEFVLPVVSHLRRWSRETPSPQHRKQVVQLVEKVPALRLLCSRFE
jgi:nucleolar complex protein 2